MLDRFIYEDHLGRRFDGLENGVYLNEGELRNYSWSYDKINNRISRFHQAITNRKIPLYVMCSTDADAVTVKNRLTDLAETDIIAKIPGKVYAGDYYTQGYITASKKDNYLSDKRMCKIDLTLTSDDPAWYREQSYTFMPDDNGGIVSDTGTDYPYEYPFDYVVYTKGRTVTCDTIESCAFKLMIYGAVMNPSIVIGENIYTLDCVVGTGETLLVDSINKTITLTTASGQNINYFDKRSREHYIFEPIPTGQHNVTWSGGFGFDLTIIEKRSEPRWT